MTLNLTWAAHQRALLQKVRAKGKQIATSAGTVAQKVRMIRQVLIPAIRYSMVVVPFTAQALDLLDCTICKVHKAALGLSVTTSTAAVAMGRDCFGAGAGTVRGVYAQVTTDAITDAMRGSDRIARVVRGVLKAHEAGRGGGHWARVPDRLAGRWPLLAAVVRSARLGITWPALGGDGPQTQVRTSLLDMLDPEEGAAAVALNAGVRDLRELTTLSLRRLLPVGMMVSRLGCTIPGAVRLRDALVRHLRPEEDKIGRKDGDLPREWQEALRQAGELRSDAS